jgi:PleD family two-component response regulator
MGVATLRTLVAHSAVPVIVLAVLHHPAMSVEAVKIGARDYLATDVINGYLLRTTVQHTVGSGQRQSSPASHLWAGYSRSGI